MTPIGVKREPPPTPAVTATPAAMMISNRPIISVPVIGRMDLWVHRLVAAEQRTNGGWQSDDAEH
jgi:phosphopantothenate synthetase